MIVPSIGLIMGHTLGQGRSGQENRPGRRNGSVSIGSLIVAAEDSPDRYKDCFEVDA